MKYDFLLVGAGLYNSVFAHFAAKDKKRCLIIEKRSHIAGNCFTDVWEAVNVHKYGPHLFHTNEKWIWDLVNEMSQLSPFYYRPKVKYRGKLYSFPINLLTLSETVGISDPQEAQKYFAKFAADKTENLEAYGHSAMGKELFDIFIKGYTEKQWGKPCSQLPSSILRRIPVRFTANDNYFDDAFQGVGNYTGVAWGLLSQREFIDLELKRPFKESDKKLANKVIYTGEIDRYFDYSLGRLEYRSLRFVEKELPIGSFQGHYVVNYTGKEVPYTRITEHKYFSNYEPSSIKNKTLITEEYPQDFIGNSEPFYPINDSTNSALATQYKELAKKEPNVFFGGRLGSYRYFDMHQVIAQARTDYNNLKNSNS